MTTLEDIAFSNLQFLSEKEDFLANRYSVNKNTFIRDDDDTLYSLSDLEYPIYFTFHQLINHVHSSYEPTFHGKTKKELLDMFSVALDILSEYHLETDNSNQDFACLINDIDEKVFFIKQYYRYGWCHRAPTMIKDYLSSICRTMLNTSRLITRDYIDDLKDPGGYIQEHESNDEGSVDGSDDESNDESNDESVDGSNDEESNDESNDEESNDGNRSCSEESSDIPDLDEEGLKED